MHKAPEPLAPELSYFEVVVDIGKLERCKLSGIDTILADPSRGQNSTF
jgi:hypothetical protein